MFFSASLGPSAPAPNWAMEGWGTSDDGDKLLSEGLSIMSEYHQAEVRTVKPRLRMAHTSAILKQGLTVLTSARTVEAQAGTVEAWVSTFKHERGPLKPELGHSKHKRGCRLRVWVLCNELCQCCSNERRKCKQGQAQYWVWRHV